MIYKDYLSLVYSLREQYNSYTIQKLVQKNEDKIFNNKISPWNISLATEEDIANYNDLINRKMVSRDNHNCYISLNLTSPSALKTEKDIISTPPDYEIWKFDNPLPHRIERFTVTAQMGETLSEAKFIIAGKYVATYTGKDSSAKFADVMADADFKIKINYLLDCLTRYPEDIQNLSEQQNQNIKAEVLASLTLAPIENSILDTLSLLADESHKIIKNLLEKRVGNRFLAQAEKEGIISSASALQDYLNIRHLVHHQLDTLDNIGRFNDNELLKNEGVRQHFLDSYCELCDKPLKERINRYMNAAKYFAPFVEILNPQLIVRQESEKYIKFSKRIKERMKVLGNEQVYIQINKGSKKEIKNIRKQFPKAQIIDQINEGNLDNLLNNCQERHHFSEIYQKIEYKVNLYCLLSGKNYTPNLAWDYIRRHHLISTEETAKWDEYKKLRNELSHQYMNEEINQRMAEIFPDFIADAIQLEAKIDDLLPVIKLVKDDIYEARHANGKTVTIDFRQRRVLSIRDARDKVKYKAINNREYTPKTKSFTEEYTNGVSITTAGTNISACKLNNGIEINFEKKQIEYSDGTKIYLTDNRRFILSPRNEKIITDERFSVLKYIIGNTEINIRKNENCRFNQTRLININNNNQICEEYWSLPHADKQCIKYSVKDNMTVLKLNDNTELWLEKDYIRIFHNNIELTYANRRKFAESYNTDKKNIELMKNKQFDR